jgi:hypothetical protein
MGRCRSTFALFGLAALSAACAQQGSTSGQRVTIAGWYVTTTSDLDDSRLLADGDPLEAGVPVIVSYVPSGGVAGMDAVDLRVNNQTVHFDQDGPPYTMGVPSAPWDPGAGEYTLTAYEMAGGRSLHENTITITRMSVHTPA